MKLLIIGSTGRTGKELIKQGLAQGHYITALARKPAKIKIKNKNLKIVKGNVLKLETLEKAFENQDVILSALGHKRLIIKTNILSEGTKNIITAMKKNGIKRLICITSLGINDSRFKLGLYYTFFVIPFIIAFYFHDKSKQEKLIMQSNLEWTIIRPGMLTNGRLTKKYQHGAGLGSYFMTKMISRANLAHFMLDQVADNTYLDKITGITN